MSRLYNIEDMNTMGWEQVPNCIRLTKDQAKVKLEELINEGYNPNRLRCRPQAE